MEERAKKVNERIARKLRQNERDEEVESVDTRDEYEETLELEELKERALEESSKLQIGEQAIVEKNNLYRKYGTRRSRTFKASTTNKT